MCRVVNAVNLTKSRITWDMDLWVRLWEIILITLTGVGGIQEMSANYSLLIRI